MINNNKFSIGLWPLSGDFGSVGLDCDRVSLISRAIELGYINFDTAPNYGGGLCEVLLGEAIKSTSSHTINVTTKLGNHRSRIKSFDINHIKRTFDSTVSTLGVLPKSALLHNPRQPLPELEELIDELRLWLPSEVSLGISLSNDSIYPINFINSLDISQIDYNFLFKHSQEDSLNNIQARSVFATGLLLKPSDVILDGFTQDDQRASWVKDQRALQLSSSVRRFQSLCVEHGISRLSACLSLPFYDSKVNSIVIGIKNEHHLSALDSFLQSPLNFNSHELISWRDSLCTSSGY